MADSEDLDLVTVFETADTFALTLAKSSLEDAGIDYLVSGDDPTYSTGHLYGVGATPLLGVCSCEIQVARESEAEALALLEPLKAPADVEPEQDS